MIRINGTLTIADPVRLNGRVVVNQQIEVGGVVMTLATYLKLVQATGDDPFAVMSQDAVTRLMQEKLVSGQNIKTINGESVLGEGNVDIVAEAEYGTTAYWNSRTGYIPSAGAIIVYLDKATKQVGGQTVNIAGIKIGSGNGYVQDLAFVGDETAAALLAHMEDSEAHITQAERELWNRKINVDDSQEIVGETLVFNRN